MSDKKIIEESYKTSTIKRDRMRKMEALKGAFAVSIARAKKDPLFDRLIRFKKAYKLVKKQLMAKYGMKGQMAARSAAMKRR